MSKLQQLLEAARADASVQVRLYGGLPQGIAAQCGPPEVVELIARLDGLAEERRQLDEADGDACDAIWRAQRDFAALLAQLTARFPEAVIAGLDSEEATTRFWVCQALADGPTAAAVPALERLLEGVLPGHHRDLAGQALAACRRRGAWWRFW